MQCKKLWSMVLGKVLGFRLLHSAGKQVGTWDLIDVVISSEPTFIIWLITTWRVSGYFQFPFINYWKQCHIRSVSDFTAQIASVFSNNSISVWNANLMKELSLLLFELIYGLCNPTSDDYILSWVCEALQKLLLCCKDRLCI